MKKIINGRVYDTATAKLIGSKTHGESTSDFGYWSEALYKKRTGEYFLHGEGGPMTRYAGGLGDNSWGWGEKLIPLTADKARKWAETNLDADAYIQEFGEPVDDDEGKITLCIQVAPTLNAILRRRASENAMSLTAYITSVLQEHEQ